MLYSVGWFLPRDGRPDISVCVGLLSGWPEPCAEIKSIWWLLFQFCSLLPEVDCTMGETTVVFYSAQQAPPSKSPVNRNQKLTCVPSFIKWVLLEAWEISSDVGHQIYCSDRLCLRCPWHLQMKQSPCAWAFFTDSSAMAGTAHQSSVLMLPKFWWLTQVPRRACFLLDPSYLVGNKSQARRCQSYTLIWWIISTSYKLLKH